MKSANCSGPIGWFVPSFMPVSISSAVATPCTLHMRFAQSNIANHAHFVQMCFDVADHSVYNLQNGSLVHLDKASNAHLTHVFRAM